MFSQAQYEAVIRELENGTTTLEAKLAEVGPAAHSPTNHWWITPPAAEAINWIAKETVEVGTSILRWIRDLLKGATAPIWMFIDSYRWMDIKGKANGVSTDLTTQSLIVDDTHWSGTARDAYLAAAGAQSTSAARIGSIAGNTTGYLLGCAAAGLGFYIVLAGVLAKLIAATVAAIAAFGSAVFSWAGAAIVLEEASVNTGIIVTATSTLALFLGAQPQP
ncbi:hypothetical protein GCM10010172_28970 [Paractinoplanes ferrugineus]|uniref:Uncharacterized protein n=1 Tax=Paractinoplanes ferrugineus TaxID=113564 RepID=A0A919MA05_9ACTN|nr:hypothetical protein [Actinoplanes ferrugineus]GIE08193.1 hypothetical protein Afe05nite_00330 [Actinoplanes ferrugineus]